jgi:hypothetical protein
MGNNKNQKSMTLKQKGKLFLKRFNKKLSPNYSYVSGLHVRNTKSGLEEELQFNLCIIGSAKSGTTTLHNLLNEHGDVFLSSPFKEPGYFFDLDKVNWIFRKSRGHGISSYDQLLKDYMLQGFSGQKVLGESSTYYTMESHGKDQQIAERLYKHNPSMKLIYMVRNPISRMVSNYLHIHDRGRTEDDFNSWFAEKRSGLVSTSSYHSQLSPFLEKFDSNQIKVIVFEEFIRDQQKGLDEVCKFLEITPKEYTEIKKNNVSKNREEFEPEDLLLSESNYASVIEVTTQEKAALETYLGRTLDVWDLGKDKWMKK